MINHVNKQEKFQNQKHKLKFIYFNITICYSFEREANTLLKRNGCPPSKLSPLENKTDNVINHESFFLLCSFKQFFYKEG